MRYRGQNWITLKEYRTCVLALNLDNEKQEIKVFPKLKIIK